MSRSRNRTLELPPVDETADDPIGLVEEYAIDQDWSSDRPYDNELWMEIPSQWGGHRLWVAYHDDTQLLQFNCYLTLKIPDRNLSPVATAMAMINERVWLGHFEVWMEELTPVFRVVLPLRGSSLTSEQLEDVMTSIFQESDRFYPVFQWVIWGGKSPAEAVAAAVVETDGEA
ncbi:MAG: YbjN domain-containing protein [Magnetococcales bacterium]|nr:YbjN domain-containing protein [Magnetococcales bacterium]